MSTLVLEDVSKTYPNGTKVVDSITIRIEDEELLVLAGPSGCGKTTTLRMIAGLEEISAGSIFIDTVRINDLSPRRRNVAMVFQNYALYPHMTVSENLSFSLKMRGVPRSTIKKLIQETAGLLGIQDILQRKPGLLSGGQQQRVALGRAIVRHPKVFLFDEPLSNLDAHLRAQMRTELSRLHTRLATTMVYVTHDQLEAMSMGEKIAVMNMGQIQQVADPITIYERPANKFVAGFFGTPPINFFHGNIVLEDNKLWFESKGLRFPVPELKYAPLREYGSTEVIMGIRPEQITCDTSLINKDAIFELTAYIEVIEPLGSETIVYLTYENHDFVARLDTHRKVSVGDRLNIFFNMDKSLFFDRRSEKTIV